VKPKRKVISAQSLVKIVFLPQSIEAKILRPEGGPFGLIEKTAFGPCKCSRSFRIGLEGEEETWKAEVVLTPTPHFVIKATGREDIVGTVTSQRVGLRSTYNVTFSRPDIPPNVKAIVIVFAIILVRFIRHIKRSLAFTCKY